jgi:hypothetical protein
MHFNCFRRLQILYRSISEKIPGKSLGATETNRETESSFVDAGFVTKNPFLDTPTYSTIATNINLLQSSLPLMPSQSTYLFDFPDVALIL